MYTATWICPRRMVMSEERTRTQLCLYTLKLMCIEGSAHFARKHTKKNRCIIIIAQDGERNGCSIQIKCNKCDENYD